MSAVDQQQEIKQEIIIVRRGGGDGDDHHHGGVWKIAFADFMTAMMCFFLVMWLVNAANEQTKASVASYFNPVTLMDHESNRSGVDDLGRGAHSANDPDRDREQTTESPIGPRRTLSGPAQEPSASDLAETRQTTDQHLFADPYAVLAEIARETATLQNISSRGDGGAQSSGPATGAAGGESYRDPFAPDFWSQQISPPDIAAAAESAEQTGEPLDGLQPEKDVHVDAEITAIMAPLPEEVEATETVEVEFDEKVPTERTERLAQELKAELSEVFGRDDRLNEAMEIVPQRSAVLISLTDEFKYGMFEIGSAVPQQQLVLAMEKIGAALDAREGRVVIKGHTDGRPFRSEQYDNWRLSSARAHAAYYMLVRGGLKESRIAEITGHADRSLKIPEDPYADANRRIEIFLELD